MFRLTDDIQNWVLEATDGEIGSVKDFLFDDESWKVRYMVADTGNWLPGRKVLISPQSLGQPRPSDWRVPIRASKEQIENSPPLEVSEPVNRNYEQRWHDYYAMPYYWTGGAGGEALRPAGLQSDLAQQRGYYGTQRNPVARNLKSAGEVSGFYVHATDGEIGHIEGFVLDDEDWSIRYVVVDTRNWLPGKKVLVSSRWFRDVNWPDQTISVDLTRDAVKNSPEYDPATLNRGYETRLHQHYGFPPYWE